LLTVLGLCARAAPPFIVRPPDHDRYVRAISGPAPFGHFGGGPFKRCWR
jgi:hypothetical protein